MQIKIAIAAVSALLFMGSAVPALAISENANPVAFENQDNAPACPGSQNDTSVRCHARVVINKNGAPSANSGPKGLSPAQMRGAYSLTGTAPAKTVIAIVDAYDNPNVAKDLDTYSQTFGIPKLPACVGSVAASAVPCFQKLNQRGTTSMPNANAGWALEIALDVESAHAICQNCSILLIEADSNGYNDLMAGVDRAVALGATVVSNSYGSPEFNGQSAFNSHFDHPGVAFTFSSGDSGYGTQYPASSPYVTAVGGTSLFVNADNTRASEVAWNGAGSGCSAYEAQPSWQAALSLPGCTKRMVADVSAVADPNTGAAIYMSYNYKGKTGWFQVGGTSLAAPVIAGVYALSGNTAGAANSIPYLSNISSFINDVLSGSNGTCGGSYLCTAMASYDGPTGLGSPKGIGAF